MWQLCQTSSCEDCKILRIESTIKNIETLPGVSDGDTIEYRYNAAARDGAELFSSDDDFWQNWRKMFKMKYRVLFFSWVKVYWGCAFKWESKCLILLFIYILSENVILYQQSYEIKVHTQVDIRCVIPSPFSVHYYTLRFWSFDWDPMKRNRTNLACTMWSGATISQ